MLPSGTTLGEKYRLDRVIGAGGMGVVFAATHVQLRSPVAVKVLRREQSDDPRAASRLVHEAQTIASLRSEHVARVFDVGEHDGAPFLVMELLDGRTVQDVVRDEGSLACARAIDIAIQACHALGDAHSRGIVHRDVKPSNLFLTAGNSSELLKIIDFGIAKAHRFGGDVASLETRTGTLLGSPSFMSPEQIRSSAVVDARSDIWSLGIVLYFVLTGQRPFDATSLLDLMTLVVHERHPALRAIRHDVPEAIEKVVDRCLEKDPERRFSSTAELARALAPFASERWRELVATIPEGRPPIRVDGEDAPALAASIDSGPATRTVSLVSGSSSVEVTSGRTSVDALAGALKRPAPEEPLTATTLVADAAVPSRVLRRALAGVATVGLLSGVVVLAVHARPSSDVDASPRTAEHVADGVPVTGPARPEAPANAPPVPESPKDAVTEATVAAPSAPPPSTLSHARPRSRSPARPKWTASTPRADAVGSARPQLPSTPD